MKKNALFMLFAGTVLASCVSEDLNVNPQSQGSAKLTFDSPVMYHNGGTRANYRGEIGSHSYEGSSTIYSYPKEEDFVIYAVQHDAAFSGWSNATPHEINNTPIKYDQSVDGWAPKNAENDYYYWPEGFMSFAAASPADLEVANAQRAYGDAGLTITDFEILNDASKHYDLLFSTRTIDKTSADMAHGASYYSGIPIQFQHALSSVRFSIKNETDAEVVLKEIKVYGLKYKGDFAENLTEDAADYSKYIRNDNVNPTWTLDNDLVAEENAYLGFSGSVGFPIEAQYVASLAASDVDQDGENEISNQLILMPQELPAEAIVKVTYTVNGNTHHKTAELRGWEDLSGNPVDAWEMGVRYTYRLVYSSSTAAKDKIYFSPSTDNWVEHDVVVITL